MNSCLYECQVMHARFSPRQHRFSYRIFLFAIDLDELPALHCALRLFSVSKRNLYSFRDADYLPMGDRLHRHAAPHSTGRLKSGRGFLDDDALSQTSSEAAPSTLKSRVLSFLGQHQIDLTGGRVVLITLPRVMGFLFNPVSFYFCYDRAGSPVAVIPEVTNTFREMKPYLLGPENRRADGRFHLRIPKHFYVSPFSDVDVCFDFRLSPPGRHLGLQIDDFIGEERTLTSTVTGPMRPLNDSRLAWFSLLYPLITLKIIAAIHWHALRLYWKNVPWFRKAARPSDQRDLYRPHASLLQPKTSDT